MHYSSFFAHDLILALGQRVCARQNPPTIENRVAKEIVEAPVVAGALRRIESRIIGAFLLTADDGRRHDTAKQHRMDEEASGRPRHGLRRRQTNRADAVSGIREVSHRAMENASENALRQLPGILLRMRRRLRLACRRATP